MIHLLELLVEMRAVVHVERHFEIVDLDMDGDSKFEAASTSSIREMDRDPQFEVCS